jgi:hypothetical protein
MGFNLNRSNHPDYALKDRQIHEMISIYGVEMDFLFVKRMNIDPVLRDFSHLRMKEGDSTKITMLPENSAGWDGEFAWDMFGLHNKRQITFFVSRKSCEDVLLTRKEEVESDIKKGINPPILGRERLGNVYSLFLNSLVVLPSGTILEITDITTQTEGINNLFTYADDNSVYTFTTVVYYNSQQNEVEYDPDKKDDLSTKPQNVEQNPAEAPKIDYQETGPTDAYEESFEDLDTYFNSLEEDKEEQDIRGAEKSNSDSVFGSLG